MGSFSVACFITGAPITHKDEVALFVVKEDNHKYSHCTSDENWDVSLPVFGKYNDYGDIEDIHNPNMVKSYPIEKHEYHFDKTKPYYLMCHKKAYDYILSLYTISENDLKDAHQNLLKIIEADNKANPENKKPWDFADFALSMLIHSYRGENHFINIIVFGSPDIKDQINKSILKDVDSFIKEALPLTQYVSFLKQLSYLSKNFAHIDSMGQSPQYKALLALNHISNQIIIKKQIRQLEDQYFEAVVSKDDFTLDTENAHIELNKAIQFIPETFEPYHLNEGEYLIRISSETVDFKNDHIDTSLLTTSEKKQLQETDHRMIDMYNLFKKVSFHEGEVILGGTPWEITDHNDESVFSTFDLIKDKKLDNDDLEEEPF